MGMMERCCIFAAVGQWAIKRIPATLSGICGGDDGLEGENPERARDCIFARKRFPASPSTKNPPDNVGGIVRGDDGNRTRVISLED